MCVFVWWVAQSNYFVNQIPKWLIVVVAHSWQLGWKQQTDGFTLICSQEMLLLQVFLHYSHLTHPMEYFTYPFILQALWGKKQQTNKQKEQQQKKNWTHGWTFCHMCHRVSSLSVELVHSCYCNIHTAATIVYKAAVTLSQLYPPTFSSRTRYFDLLEQNWSEVFSMDGMISQLKSQQFSDYLIN